jgi:ribonuclease Z
LKDKHEKYAMVKLQILGTSGSVPTERRGMPAIYIEHRGKRLLFDCGEGTQRQMRIAKIPFMKLDKIFISHLHADHCLGLGGMIQTMDLFKRNKKLEIYGPKGIHDVIEKVITTGHFVLEGFDLEINEIKPRKVIQIYADEDFIIKCALLDHGVPSLGFSFEEAPKRKFLKKKALSLGVPEGILFKKLQSGDNIKVGNKTIKPDEVLADPVYGKKITYIPDTRPCAAAVELAKDSDILIHDSTFSHELQDSAIEGKHSTAREAAEIAKKANVKKLYLNHFSQRYTDLKGLEKEARGVFSKSYAAKDFDVVEL